MIISKIDFQSNARKNKIAIDDGMKKYSYYDLREYSTIISNFIIRKEYYNESIGLFFNHSSDMIIAMISSIRSGNNYVPLDIEHPTKKLISILTNTNINCVLTNNSYEKKIKDIIKKNRLDIDVLNIENIMVSKNINRSFESHDIKRIDIAYILYTSGSTGEAKGVIQTQRNICYFAENFSKELRINENSNIILLSKYTHDASVLDIYASLINGATLYIIDVKKAGSFRKIEEKLNENKITLWHSVPTLFRAISKKVKNSFHSMEYVVLGGEEIHSNDLDLVKNVFPKAKLYCLYGQTESTFNSGKFIDSKFANNEITLGKAIQDTNLFIYKDGMQIKTDNLVGEIVVESPAISPFYKINGEQKPVKQKSNLYFTGDLGEILPTGEIKFIGRKDHQIKINGQRVEIGEIENVLLKKEEIIEAAVLYIPGEKLLSAYIVWDENLIDSNDIYDCMFEYMKKNLPYYMIPAKFHLLKEIPKTNSGKINRKELKNISSNDRSSFKTKSNTFVQKKLVSIYNKYLNVDDVLIEQSFLQQGGDSLDAMMILSDINEEFDVSLNLSDLFENSSIIELEKILSNCSKKKNLLNKFFNKEKLKIQEATSAQLRLYTIQNNQQCSLISYNEPKLIELNYKLQINKLNRALNSLIHRHESLRTSFHMRNGKLIQKVHENATVNIEYEFCKNFDLKQRQKIVEDFVKPFNLKAPPLIRIKLIETIKNCYLFIDVHHIIADGTSLSIIIRDLLYLYNGIYLKPLEYQYKDYIYEKINSKISEKEKLFWRKKFSYNDIQTILPAIYKKNNYLKETSSSVAIIHFSLDTDLVQKIKDFCTYYSATRYMVLFSVFNILVSKYTQQENIVVGTPFSNRNKPMYKKIVGMFANTLPIKTKVKSNYKIIDYFKHFKDELIEYYKYGNLDLEQIKKAIKKEKFTTNTPILSILFSLQEFEIDKKVKSDLDIKSIKTPFVGNKFDFALIFDDKKNLSGHVEYNTSIYSNSEMEMLIKRYKKLLKELMVSPYKYIKDLDLLLENEIEEVLFNNQNNHTPYPKNKTIDEVFKETVDKYGNKIAIHSENFNMSYKEVFEKASYLATNLLESGVQKKETIALICEKNIETIVTMIGIIMAGANYLPIDVKYPEDRIKYIIQNCGCKHILRKKGQKFNISNVKCLYIEELFKETPLRNYCFNLPTDTAYVIYTSGSSGRPKGVEIGHKSLIKICKNINYFSTDSYHRLLHMGSFSFDASVQQIWLTLLNGMTLYIEEDDLLLDMEYFKKYIDLNRITSLIMPTILFNQLGPSYACIFDNIEQLIVGGDILNVKQVESVFNRNKTINIINGYGPTENTIISTFYEISKDFTEREIIPIGKPVSNTNVFLMDFNDKLVPKGFVGEIYLSGDGLAKGYVNNEKEMKKRFIENPYNPKERLYKTGDLAKWNNDGDLVYIGRKDNQVKLRGYRVELSEIENQIQLLPGVKEVVVMLLDNHTLASYYSTYNSIVTEKFIKKSLKKVLPEFMIPVYFIHLNELPLSPNGKIDKKTLPLPIIDEKTNDIKNAQNQVQEIMLDTWKEVFMMEELGVTTNFFEIGGDSIKAIQIVSRLRNKDLVLKVNDILKYKNIEKLEKYTVNICDKKIIKKEKNHGEAPILPIYEKFHNNDNKMFNHFNQSLLLQSRVNIDIDILQKAFNIIYKKHEALRAYMDRNRSKIKIDPQLNPPVIKEFNIFDENKIREMIIKKGFELQGNIDIFNPDSIIQVALFHTKTKDFILLIFHHITIDSVSWDIIIEDLTNIYLKLLNKEKMKISNRYSSYLEWLLFVKEEEFIKKTLRDEKDYWKKVSLAVDDNKHFDVNASEYQLYNKRNIIINETITKLLTNYCNEIYNTETKDILISALGIALNKTFNKSNFSVNLEGHGRELISDQIDVTRTVGWFTIYYPIIINCSEFIEKCIIENKEMLRRIPNNGFGYGIVKESEKIKEVEKHNIPDVLFNYYGIVSNYEQNPIFKLSEFDIRTIDIHRKFNFGEVIQINTKIKDGTLIWELEADSNQVSDEMLESLTTNVTEAINVITNHCLEKSKKIKTSTDFGVNTCSQKNIEELQCYLKNKFECTCELQRVNSLTSLQLGMYVEYLKNKDASAYIIQNLACVYGKINKERWTRAIKQLLRKYDVLRTRILETDGLPIQIVISNYQYDISYFDFSVYNIRKQKAKIQRVLKKEREKKFKLNEDQLIRFTLFKLDHETYKFLITAHHIILDGWSIDILLGELLKLYNNNIFDVKQESSFFDDFLPWLFNKGKKETLDYWGDYLKGYSPKIVNNSNGNKYINEKLTFCVNQNTYNKIKSIGIYNGITMNEICQALWAINLGYFLDENDIVLGTVVSGRSGEIKGIEKSVGNFINTIPIRVIFNRDESLIDIVRKVKCDMNTSRDYDYVPLNEVQSLMKSDDSIINSLTVFENYPVKKFLRDGEVFLQESESFEQTHYDINVAFIERESLNIEILFNKEILSFQEVECLKSNFISLVNSFSADNCIKIKNIDLDMSCTQDKKIEKELDGLFGSGFNF